MLRNDSSADIRQLHVDGLKDVYRQFSVSDGTNGAIVVSVVEPFDAASGDGSLTLYVTLDNGFPQSAPDICTASGRPLRCAPPGEAWRGDQHVLAEAVREGFAHVRELWGPVRPPTLSSLAAALLSLSSDTISDIITNAQCRETFAYQLPVCKQMREETKVLADRVERAAQQNAEVAATVSRESETLQLNYAALQQNMTWLDENRTLVSELLKFSSDEAITKLFVKGAKSLQQESEEIEKRILSLNAPDQDVNTRELESLKEQYLRCRSQYHDMELRRRAFVASLKK